MALVINLYVGIATCFSTMILFSNCLFMLKIFESLPCKYIEILSIILYNNIYFIAFNTLSCLYSFWQNVAKATVLYPKAKLVRFHDINIGVVDNFVTLLTEAEEETGSAEEQPVSNKLPVTLK